MANVKISALPSWTGSSADLRWFVMNNSGETETFKFSGYTSQIVPSNGSNSVRSLYFTSNKNLSPYGVLIGGLDNNEISSTGNYNTIIGGEGSTITAGEDNGIFAAKNSTIGSSASYSSIVGGRNHNANNQFAFIGGGAQNTAGYLSAAIAGFNLNATNQACILGGENNTTTGAYSTILGGTGNNISGNYSTIVGSQNSLDSGTNAGFIGGGRYNSLGGGNSDSNFTVGGQYSIAQGINSGVLGGWGTYIYDDGNNSDDTYRRSNIIVGSPYSEIGVSSSNGRNFAGIYSSLYSYIRGVSAAPVKVSTLLGTSGSTIQQGNNYVHIFGGYNNNIGTNGSRNLILNSIESRIEKDNQYSSVNVNYIGCDNVDTENLTGVTFINCSNITRENGGFASGTTVMQNTLTTGANQFSADSYTATTITIDPNQQDYIEIITDGSSTYNIDIPTVDSRIYANIHLYIDYVSGSTINFVSGGNTQWRWGNNLGAPVFSGTNKNIIVLSTWSGNDVWEVSRSMYMS